MIVDNASGSFGIGSCEEIHPLTNIVSALDVRTELGLLAGSVQW
jgi:hypothetical protein